MRRPLDVGRIAETLARRWVGEDALRLERLRARWATLVGATVARRTYPARLDGATLWIHVHDEQWLHEMRWLRQPLLDRLAATDVGSGITGLEFRRGHVPAAEGPNASPRRPGDAPAPGVSPPSTPSGSRATDASATPARAHESPAPTTDANVDETLRDAIAAIEDAELRARLMTLAETAAASDRSHPR